MIWILHSQTLYNILLNAKGEKNKVKNTRTLWTLVNTAIAYATFNTSHNNELQLLSSAQCQFCTTVVTNGRSAYCVNTTQITAPYDY